MRIAILALRWIVGIFLMLIGLTSISESALGGLLILCSGLWTIPSVRQLIKVSMPRSAEIVLCSVVSLVGVAIAAESRKKEKATPPTPQLAPTSIPTSSTPSVKVVQNAKTSPIPEPTATQTTLKQVAVKEPTPVPAPSETEIKTIKISATDLSRAYKENEISADYKYKGKEIIVTGVINRFSKGMLGGLNLTLKTPFYDVSCSFEKSQEKVLATLSNGERIEVKGVLTGKFWSINIENCEIAKN